MNATRLLVCSLVLASHALADIPPRDTAGCSARRLGQACTTDERHPGTCAPATCSRRDYSSGLPPKSVAYECLKCVEHADAGAAAPDAGTK